MFPAGVARADIFEWEYIDPDDPGLGKQQSTKLVPNGAGADAVPLAWLSGFNLTMAYLAGTDLTRANLSQATLTDADLSQANLTAAVFAGATLTTTTQYSWLVRNSFHGQTTRT